VTPFYETALCSILSANAETELFYNMFMQVINHHLSSTSYEAQSDTQLIYANKKTTYECIKLN
jgi:hypothetical protein